MRGQPAAFARDGRRACMLVAAALTVAFFGGCNGADDTVADRAVTPGADDGAQDTGRMQTAYAPQFTSDGELLLPPNEIWREWPQVGTPLTPNALNGGEAPFPEFHSVYIDPGSWEIWRRTGEFRDGTVLAKELVSVVGGADALPDGSTLQVSGRGYFMGDFIGFEIAYKSREHFPDAPGNWAYFTFGHHPQPYAASTPPMSLDQCSTCHQASAAEDFVFTQFYPVLRSAKGGQ